MNAEQKPDFGDHLGLAAKVRKSSIVEIEAESRGSVQRGDVIEARRYEDVTIFDRLNQKGQFSDRQATAGNRLLSLANSAGLVGGGCGSYEPRTSPTASSGRPDGKTPLDEYRGIMRELGQHRAGLLEKMLFDERHPGTQWLATMQVGAEGL